MPLLFSPVYSPTCLLQLQSFFIWSLHGDVHSPTLWCSVPCLPLLQAHWGRWRHTHLLQLACLFRVRVGKCPSPTPVELSTWQPLFQGFPAPRFLGRCCQLLPSLAGLFIYSSSEGVPLSRAQGALPSLLHIFFFSAACLLLSLVFFSFFPGQGSVYPGGYADLSQGVPHATYLLTSWSPKQVRSWCLAAQEPSWFLRLTWSGDAMRRLRVRRCWSFASSWWFFLSGVSPASLQEFTLGSTLSASSL
jgi:hypothetical protein